MNKFEIQEQFCIRNDHPIFISENGNCPICRKNIFDKLSEVKLNNELITGCPHCNFSYCD